MEQYVLVSIDDGMNKKNGILGQFLHNILFMEWTYTSTDIGRPPVSFLEEYLVGKYVYPVIYYVAGWTL